MVKSIRGEQFEASYWKFFKVQCFKQTNDYDCGILALKFVFCLLSLSLSLFDCYDSKEEREELRELVRKKTKFVRSSGDFSECRVTFTERDCRFNGVSFLVDPISEKNFLKLFN